MCRKFDLCEDEGQLVSQLREDVSFDVTYELCCWRSLDLLKKLEIDNWKFVRILTYRLLISSTFQQLSYDSHVFECH